MLLPALLTIVVILFGLLFYYCYSTLLKYKAHVRLLHFQNQIYFTLASNINDSQNFEEAVSLFVSVFSKFTPFNVCSYTVKTTKEIKFKAYLNSEVNLSYLKILQKKSLEYFSKKSKITNLTPYTLVESISGHNVNNSLDFNPGQIVMVPIVFKNLILGVFTVSYNKKTYYSQSVIKQIKKLIKDTFVYIFELQEVGKQGTAKEEYTNMIIHDLRAPLSIIMGSADILIKRKSQLTAVMSAGIIGDIKNAAKRLLNIVDNLLDIAHLESGKFRVEKQKINIIDFFNELTKQYKVYVEERGLKYKVVVPKSANIFCNIDPHNIERVFDNFISNAVKYTKEGTITVTITVLSSKNKIKIQITDTGLGIPKDKQKLLFNKFEQIVNPVDNSSKSTGLGLVVSKKLVEENGGKVGFLSAENKGSTFYFVLPTLKS